MPRRKITPELWALITEAYRQWTPGDPGAGTIDDLLRPYGISKQAFYAERRRLGLHGKTTPVEASSDENTIRVLLNALVDCRLRCSQLEHELVDIRRRQVHDGRI